MVLRKYKIIFYKLQRKVSNNNIDNNDIIIEININNIIYNSYIIIDHNSYYQRQNEIMAAGGGPSPSGEKL